MQADYESRMEIIESRVKYLRQIPDYSFKKLFR